MLKIDPSDSTTQLVIQHYMNADSYNTWEDEENRTNSQRDRSNVEGEVEEILKDRLNNEFLEVLVV